MKFTTTALAFLGATSLVTAAPVNITSSTNNNTLASTSNLPGCGFWVGNWCHMEMQLDRGPDAMASYTQCCHNHNCEPDLANQKFPPPSADTSTLDSTLTTREESQPRCGAYRSFGCNWEAQFSHGNITENYRECMWRHGCDPDDGPEFGLDLDWAKSE